MFNSSPVVMSVADLDPTGGGGIAADIETLSSLGCHCTPIMTAISIQDTSNLKDSAIVDSTLLLEQMRVVLEDMDVSAIKLHQLACTSHVETIHSVLRDYPDLPVILDPSLWSVPLEEDFCDALLTLLFPYATLVVLTAEEAFELTSGADSLTACAHQLLDYGCENLLITCQASPNTPLRSSLYARRGLREHFDWRYLRNDFVGAGSTFSAAIAGYVGHGVPLQAAIRQAQEYTWKALHNARRLGMGKLVPDRSHFHSK